MVKVPQKIFSVTENDAARVIDFIHSSGGLQKIGAAECVHMGTAGLLLNLPHGIKKEPLSSLVGLRPIT